jgi:hypothetical protein
VNVTGPGGPNQTQQTQHQPPLVGTQSSPTVGTQTGPEPTDEGAPGVSTAEETPSGEGAVPSPESDPQAYADSLEATIEEQEDLQALREQLEYLAERGDAKAAELLGKLNAALLSERDYDKLMEEYDEYAMYTSNEDFDGDGIKNKDDVDADGDGVTREAEDLHGTSDFNVDSDGDGITDYGELYLQGKGYWVDPTNPDANHNGIIDGKELPSSISFDGQGNSILVGGQPKSGEAGAEGAGTASSNLVWGNPSGDAQTVDGATGGTIDGEGDVVFNASGDLDIALSEDGNDLIITQGGVTTTIKNFESRKIYMNGTSEKVTFHDMNAGVLNAQDSDSDGFADTGVKWGDGINVASSSNSYDPFNGSVAVDEAASTPTETVYNCNGVAATWQLPDMGGNVVEITFEGNDAIVIVRDKTGGDPLHTYRLKDGKTAVENGDITFKGTDANDYFYTEGKVTVYGGKGNDFIAAGAGSQIYGEDGNDVLSVSGTASGSRLDGGAGDDVMEGSDGVDNLVGGSGNDAMYTGTSEGDSLDGGTGDDIGIVSNTDVNANYTIQMGGGIDMSNATNTAVVEGGSVDVRMDDLDGLRGFLEGQQTEASGAMLEEIKNSTELTDNAAQMAASTVRDAFLAYLMKKKSQLESSFGADHSGGYGDDTDPVSPPPEEEEGP